MTRVLAVASSGGHWIQLQRLRPAWDGCEVTYLTTAAGHRQEVEQDATEQNHPLPGFFSCREANKNTRFDLIVQLAQVAWVVLKVRPNVVISTGAAVGVFASRLGALLGARTVWIDSIANAEALSLSARLAGRFADLWLTQWEHLTQSDGSGQRAPEYRGAVL